MLKRATQVINAWYRVAASKALMDEQETNRGMKTSYNTDAAAIFFHKHLSLYGHNAGTFLPAVPGSFHPATVDKPTGCVFRNGTGTVSKPYIPLSLSLHKKLISIAPRKWYRLCMLPYVGIQPYEPVNSSNIYLCCAIT